MCKKDKNKILFKKKTKYGTVILTKKSSVILGVTTVMIIIGLAVVACNTATFLMDGAVGGRGEGKTEAELQAELQKVTDESMFRIKINERPSMNVETGATNIIVQNSVENTFNKKVKYYDLDGVLIYETRELYPGDDELSATFEGDWNKGEYQLVADVVAIDKELEEEFVVTTMDIILTVKDK